MGGSGEKIASNRPTQAGGNLQKNRDLAGCHWARFDLMFGSVSRIKRLCTFAKPNKICKLLFSLHFLLKNTLLTSQVESVCCLISNSLHFSCFDDYPSAFGKSYDGPIRFVTKLINSSIILFRIMISSFSWIHRKTLKT